MDTFLYTFHSLHLLMSWLSIRWISLQNGHLVLAPKVPKLKLVDPGDLDPPYQTWRLFETEIFTSTGLYVTFKLSDFLKIKHGLHFATKLNSRDIWKCNYFGVSSYDPLPLLAKQYFQHQWWLAFTDWETRGHLCEK